MFLRVETVGVACKVSMPEVYCSLGVVSKEVRLSGERIRRRKMGRWYLNAKVPVKVYCKDRMKARNVIEIIFVMEVNVNGRQRGCGRVKNLV